MLSRSYGNIAIVLTGAGEQQPEVRALPEQDPCHNSSASQQHNNNNKHDNPTRKLVIKTQWIHHSHTRKAPCLHY